jgi:hypothetical protein
MGNSNRPTPVHLLTGTLPPELIPLLFYNDKYKTEGTIHIIYNITKNKLYSF